MPAFITEVKSPKRRNQNQREKLKRGKEIECKKEKKRMAKLAIQSNHTTIYLSRACKKRIYFTGKRRSTTDLIYRSI